MKLVVLVSLSLLVAGCGWGQRSPDHSAEWSQRKAACAAGDYEACAEIGHQARDQMGGPAKVETPLLSTPIID